MALLHAQCKSCGANLDIQEGQEMCFCSHCGAKFVNEKVVQNNFTTNQTIHQKVVNQNVMAAEDEDNLFARASTFIDLREYRQAAELFRKMINIAPGDYRGWLGLCIAETENWSLYSDAVIKNYMPKALKLSSPEDKELFVPTYQDYLSRCVKTTEVNIKTIKKAKARLKFKRFTLVLLGFLLFAGACAGLYFCWTTYNVMPELMISVGITFIALFFLWVTLNLIRVKLRKLK